MHRSIISARRAAARQLLSALAVSVTALTACERTGPERLGAPAPARILVCDPSVDPSCDPPPPVSSPHTEKFGVGVGGTIGDLANNRINNTQLRKIMGYAKQLGTTAVRDDIVWDFAQPSGPSFEPTYLDAVDQFVRAASDSGLEPYFSILRTPFWARLCYQGPEGPEGHGTGPDCNPTSTFRSAPHPAMWAYWRSFVQALVDRYDGAQQPLVKYWSIGNEPNDTAHFRYDGYPNWMEAYYLMFSYAADAVQSRPGRIIAGPELGWGTSSRGRSPEDEFTEFVNRLNYRFRPQDILSFHYYPDAWALEGRVQYLHQAAVNAQIGQNQLWLTESSPALESEEGVNDYYQATTMTQLYQAALGTPTSQWTKTFKFTLLNVPTRELIRNATSANPTIRPAYYCMQALAFGWALPSGCQ